MEFKPGSLIAPSRREDLPYNHRLYSLSPRSSFARAVDTCSGLLDTALSISILHGESSALACLPLSPGALGQLLPSSQSLEVIIIRVRLCMRTHQFRLGCTITSQWLMAIIRTSRNERVGWSRLLRDNPVSRSRGFARVVGKFRNQKVSLRERNITI